MPIKQSLHPNAHHAEFDRYADNYDGGMENPVKKLVGENAHQFIEVKVTWLLDDLRAHPLTKKEADNEVILLDYGCGTGYFLKSLSRKRSAW